MRLNLLSLLRAYEIVPLTRGERHSGISVGKVSAGLL